MCKVKEIVIDGVTYTPKSEMAASIDNMPFVLIRGYSSGVQYGYLSKHAGSQVTLANSRRIWNWNKATETSQLAVEGCDPASSKVTLVCPEKIIIDVIEIISITKKGAENLIAQPIWKK